jgi:D-alanyl-D-alanine carboxypeptidase
MVSQGGVTFSASEERYESPIHDDVALPQISAESWAVFDVEGGEVLQGTETDRVSPIASITKLFTAVVALKSSLLDESVLITHDIMVTEGVSGKLWYGDEMTVRELLYPMLLESSNDASEAVRKRIGTDSFESGVSEVLAEAGLHSTRIVDASGLSPKNVSTAEELALLYVYLRDTHPHVLDITQVKTYVGRLNGYVNNNPGVSIQGFQGGKQGYLDEAGYTFVGGYKLQSGARVGVVLLGSDDLSSDIREIVAYAERLDMSSAIMSP